MREMTRYEKDLNQWLKDPDNAAEYLTAKCHIANDSEERGPTRRLIPEKN